MVQAQFPLQFQSLLLHHPVQQSSRRVFSPLRPFPVPSPFSQSPFPNWAPASPAASAGAGGSSSDGLVHRAVDPCSGSWIVNEIRSSSGLLSSTAMFSASTNAMGGAGDVNVGPDLETIQTEVGSSFFSFLIFFLIFYTSFSGFVCTTKVMSACFIDQVYRPSASYPSLVMPRFALHPLGSRSLPLPPRSSALLRKEVWLLPLALTNLSSPQPNRFEKLSRPPKMAIRIFETLSLSSRFPCLCGFLS